MNLSEGEDILSKAKANTDRAVRFKTFLFHFIKNPFVFGVL